MESAKEKNCYEFGLRIRASVSEKIGFDHAVHVLTFCNLQN
jgi:hypothetical protein